MSKKKPVTLQLEQRTAWSPGRAFLLGALTGSRSFTPAAVLALSHGRDSLDGDWKDWPMFRAPLGRVLVVVAAVGELVGDKSPKAPPRTSRTALIGRGAFGAVVGAALGSTAEGRGRAVLGAVLGASGALVGSVVGMRLRAAIVEASGLADPVVALGEDALAIGGSVALVRAR